METDQKLKEFLKKMKYPGNIPKGLNKLINPATSPMWEEFMVKVKSKEKVQNIRKNLILNRLKNNCSDDRFPIKEIDLWKKKQELEAEIKNLEYSRESNEETIESKKTANTRKSIELEKKKENNKKLEYRIFLLKQKVKKLDSALNEAEELNTLVKNLTPKEGSDFQKNNEVLETLRGSAKKLEILLAEEKHFVQNSSNGSCSNFSKNCNDTQKFAPSNAPDSFKLTFNSVKEENMFFSSTKNIRNISKNSALSYSKEATLSIRKNNQTTLFKGELFSSVTPKRKCLFLGKDETVSSSLGCSQQIDNSSAGNSIIFKVLSRPFNNNCETKRTDVKKQVMDDSFGLLTEEASSLDDNLLTPPNNDNSCITTMDKLNASNAKLKSTSQFNLNVNEYDTVLDEVSSIIYKYPRNLIWSTIIGELEKTKEELLQIIQSEDSAKRHYSTIDQSDLLEIRAQYMSLGMEHIKIVLTTRQKEQELSQLENKLFENLSSPGLEGMIKLIQLLKKEAGLQCALENLKKQLGKWSSFNNNTKELEKVTKIDEDLGKQISKDIRNIENYLEMLRDSYEIICCTKEDAKKNLQKLRHFTTDFEWFDILRQNKNYEEVKIFEQYPIEFNRKVKTDNGDRYYRDMFHNNYPNFENCDQSTVKLFNRLVSNSSHLFPEKILMNLYSLQNDIYALRSLPTVEYSEEKTYICNTDELNKKEEQMKRILDQMKLKKEKINAASNSDTKTLKKACQYLVEVPIKKYISKKREVDGENYDYYDEKYQQIHEH